VSRLDCSKEPSQWEILDCITLKEILKSGRSKLKEAEKATLLWKSDVRQ